jgi:hypothetical protein
MLRAATMNIRDCTNLEDFNKPKSLRWYEDGRPPFMESLYAQFMKEDVGSFIMPIAKHYSSRQASFEAQFNGSEVEGQRLRTLVSQVPEHHDRDTSDLICDVVNSIGRSLSGHGFALFERLHRKNASVAQDCLLHEIYPRRVFRVPGGHLQVTPRDALPEMNRRRWVYLPNADLWRVEMPLELGGSAGYRKILSSVARLGDGMPDFYRADAIESGRLSGFDFKVRKQAVKKYGAALTRSFGYGFRDTDSESMTECYFVYRHITFAWAKAVIRNHIVAEINRLASKIGIVARIEVAGLPSPAEIIDIRQKAITGEIAFGAALEAVRV